jgi:hypothetical protein
MAHGRQGTKKPRVTLPFPELREKIAFGRKIGRLDHR